MNGQALLLIRDFLKRECLGYNDSIHVMVTQRKAGKTFSLEEHIAGMVYALLSNQTEWSRIVPHLKDIDQLFFHYDPRKIKDTPASFFAEGIFALKCGNVSTATQMRGLAYNIGIMERLATRYGSMDAFVTSAPPHKIVAMLSDAKSSYKLKQMGEALAWEYIRNVGIDGCKPDTHMKRFLGNSRMGCATGEIASVDEVIEQVNALSKETGLDLCAIDNIIWSFCAKGYGQICTANPHCEKCVVKSYCNNCVPGGQTVKLPITHEELRRICKECNDDPLAIGNYVLRLAKDGHG